jgi:hypothetical protein
MKTDFFIEIYSSPATITDVIVERLTLDHIICFLGDGIQLLTELSFRAF